MTQGRAIGIVVLYIAWAGAAFGGSEPSRDDVVRALMQRSRLIEDVQFQLPIEIYRRYLAETEARPEKPPIGFIIEQGRYGVTLNEKNELSLRVELSVRVLDANRCREIPVLSAALAWDKVTLNGLVSKLGEKDGWLQLMPDKAGVYSIFADVKLGRAWADKARITLAASPSVRTIAKFDAPGTWRVSAGGSSHASDTPVGGGTHVELPLVPSKRIDISWTHPVVLPPRPPRYELSGTIAWNIDAGRQQVAARMNVRILGSPTDRLRLSVPPGALKCSITGPDVREMQLSGGSVVVFLRGPVTGQTRLDVSYELPIGTGAEKPLAAPVVADGHWASGTVVVTDTAGASELIAGDIRGLREIHESEIPADARAILAGKPVLAYAITSRNFDASVEVLDLGEFALRESIADAAHYQVLFRPDGSVMCKIDYEIRNRTRQFLRVHLPAGSRVLSARVNDVPKSLMPVAGESGAFLLPLVRSNASVKGLVSFPVQVVVLYRAAGLGKRGLAELPLPTIDLPIAYGWCDLYAPAGMKVRQWGGAMRQVEQFSSETAVASLSYGSAELAEGYRPEDRIKVVTAPKPAPVLSKVPIISGLFQDRAVVRSDRTRFLSPDAARRPTTQPASPRVPVREGQSRTTYVGFDPKYPTPGSQSLPIELPTVVPQQIRHIETSGTVPEGGTVLLGGQLSGQSLLAGNYYRAGKDYYEKGDYANAAEALGNVRRMAPNSVEATNAGRLLANIDVIQGKAKTASRQEKALGKKVQAEIGGQNLDLEQRQSRLLEQAGEALKSKDLARAQASYKAAEGLGYKLLAKGSSKTEQKVRMTKARKQLKRLDEQQKGQTEDLRERYRQLKAGGNVEQALEVGNALQRLSDEKDEKTVLRGELEKLAIASVQKSAHAEKADTFDMPAGQWKVQSGQWEAEPGKVKVGRVGVKPGSLDFAIKSTSGSTRFTRWGGDSDKDAPAPPVVTGESWGARRVIDHSANVRVDAEPTSLLVAELKEQAKALRSQQKYDQALEVVEQVLLIDPADKWAAREKEALTEFAILQKDVRVFRDERKEEAKSLADARASKVPWYEHLRYPRDWKQLNEDRKEFVASAAGETGADTALREKLKREIERLSFADIDFKDVITFLSDYSDANIHVNWRALAGAGIERTTKISVDVRKITVRRALDLVLRQASAAARPENELRYGIDGGVVIISTKTDFAKEPVRRVYDVRDLLTPVPNFEGPRTELAQASQTSSQSGGKGGSGGGGSGIFDDAPSGDTNGRGREMTKEKLMEDFIALFRNSMEQESWADPDGGDERKTPSLQVLNGMLVVTESAENQKAVAEVVERLRKSKKANTRSFGMLEWRPPQRVAQPGPGRGRVITRSYDVRELVIDSDGEQTVEDIARRGKELERSIGGALGEGRDKDGDGLRDDLRVVDGTLIVTADAGGQRQVGSLLKKLGDIRGPQVEMGSNIAGQQASGLVNGDSLEVTKSLARLHKKPDSTVATNGTFSYDTHVDFLNGRASRQPTEASKARFEDYIRRNYKWAFSDAKPGEKDRTGGGGGGQGGGGVLQDRDEVVKHLSEKLSKNLWQDVTVNSRNIGISAGEASQLGIQFQKGVNSVNFATVDEAQLRTLRQMEAQRGGQGRQVDANPRLQETIVGTEALLAGGQRAYVANAGESSNTLDLAGNPIVLSHEKYVLIDAGGFVTAVKAGEMKHWTQAVKEEDVGFADVPQELDLPRVGKLVKFEKTLIRPADRLTIRAEYTWKGAVK